MHALHSITRTRLTIHRCKHKMAGLISESTVNIKSKSSLHCCVPLCTSDARYDESLHFHTFPSDESLKKQWIVKIRRDEGEMFKINKKMTVVCSKHFRREDYRSWTPIRKYLKPGTVPSIFDWSANKPPRRELKRKSHSDQRLSPEKTPVHDTHMDVDFIATPIPCTSTTNDDTEMKRLKLALIEANQENMKLKNQLTIERFGVERFSCDKTSIVFYTGFTSYLSFVTFFNIIQPSANSMTSAYYVPSETVNLSGRKRGMLLIDELFLFFCRLRAGLLEHDLSIRFNCSVSTVSRKVITWTNFLYFTLAAIPIWLSRETIQRYMPKEFKALYPRTRVVIDCTELRTQTPSSLVLNSQIYSSYKSTTTFKCLLGIAPHGAVTFISSLYTGSMSDVELTKLSGILDLIEPGDDIMADKGFTLKKILEEKKATLNIPNFLSSKQQFSKGEIENTEQIAKLRIHIERMNRRVKENHLFDAPLPLSLTGSVNQLWTVACLMANFNGPLVKSWVI